MPLNLRRVKIPVFMQPSGSLADPAEQAAYLFKMQGATKIPGIFLNKE
jgi:hypothetical protein